MQSTKRVKKLRFQQELLKKVKKDKSDDESKKEGQVEDKEDEEQEEENIAELEQNQENNENENQHEEGNQTDIVNNQIIGESVENSSDENFSYYDYDDFTHEFGGDEDDEDGDEEDDENDGDGYYNDQVEHSNIPQSQASNEEEDPEIFELKVWVVKSRTPKKYVTSLLKILRKRLLKKLPKSYQTFLGTADANYSVEGMVDFNDKEGEFVYLGIEAGLAVCVNQDLHPNQILELDFNVDGVKLKPDSPKTAWPILCKINYKPMPHVYKPFPVALFYGESKPKSWPLYFQKFFAEFKNLSNNGIRLNNKQLQITFRCFICDLPARCYLKGVKGQSSCNGCERCTSVAEKIDFVMVYYLIGELRTDASFRNYCDLEHHITASVFLYFMPPIDLVKQFVLDTMHLLYLGIMLRILDYLLSGDQKVKLSAIQKAELNRRVESIREDIPEEFERKLRPSNNYSDYKAQELRFFTLYCGPIVLKKLLPDDIYINFLLFHVACRILSSENAVELVDTAEDYLKRFVEESKIFYGMKFVTLNVHLLNHIADDVRNMQCNVNSISAFPYENELGKIKRCLLSPTNITAQYCRRIHEDRKFCDLKAKVEPELIILKEDKKKNILKLKYKQYYLTRAHPNNTVLLKNGDVGEICAIWKEDDNTIKVEIMKKKIIKNLYDYPLSSNELHVHEIHDVKNQGQHYVIKLSAIARKMVKISVNYSQLEDHRVFVLPILH